MAVESVALTIDCRARATLGDIREIFYLCVLTAARNASIGRQGAIDCDVRWSDR
jgi:hypothetical protein